MGMTIAEKTLANKGGLKQVGPGDLVTVEVDTVILFDNNFMTNRWREILRVKDPDRIIVVFDHRVPAATQASAKIYMASPATVAASAITGVITDPREFLQ